VTENCTIRLVDLNWGWLNWKAIGVLHQNCESISDWTLRYMEGSLTWTEAEWTKADWMNWGWLNELRLTDWTERQVAYFLASTDFGLHASFSINISQKIGKICCKPSAVPETKVRPQSCLDHKIWRNWLEQRKGKAVYCGRKTSQESRKIWIKSPLLC